MLANVAVRIVPRVSADHARFTEIFHSWTENGEPHHALSRVPYSIDDTPYARSAQVQAFLKRRQINR